MMPIQTVAAAVLLVTQSHWLAPQALAQPEPARSARRQEPAHRPAHPAAPIARPPAVAAPGQAHPPMPQGRMHPGPMHTGPMHAAPGHHAGPGMSAPAGGAPPSMRFFDEDQRARVHRYFSDPQHQGFCPPGLRLQRWACTPPGQAKPWKRGHSLQQGLVYFGLPRSLEIELGPPPPEHRYVRLGADLLLITLGAALVVDAMEDVVR